jgi:hypothetical protein
MLHPEIALTRHGIYDAPGPDDQDGVIRQCQIHFIAEAIRETHREAVEALFMDQPPKQAGSMKPQIQLVDWPEFPAVERLPPRKTSNYGLGPITENEGTIDGTYAVIRNIFIDQLGYNPDTDFDGPLRLVYGDQKTVSLIQVVKKEQKEATLPYDRCNWLLPIPGLFHWRTNYMDMIHELYSGTESAADETTLHHNKNFLGCVQGHKSPFHHKEEVATRAFDARVTAKFYLLLRSFANEKDKDIQLSTDEEIDHYIKNMTRASFRHIVEKIRDELFILAEQQSENIAKLFPDRPIDFPFSTHAKVLQQIAIYKILKKAIKYADIGILRRIFALCCFLFHGSKKSKYAFLSLYMTWLTQTPAANPELQKAVLANGLVNIRGAEDSWFEIDRLNEFFNLQMKTLMATRRTSTLEVTPMFQQMALTASYCTELKAKLEAEFGEYSNGRHQIKDASMDIRNLAHEIARSDSIHKHTNGRDSRFKPLDILSRGSGESLVKGVEKFNQQRVHGGWQGGEDPNHLTSTPIAVLDDFVTTADDEDGIRHITSS